MLDFKEYITVNKEIRSGKACIINTRITVGDILACLASGMSYDEILIDYSELTKDAILAALSYASEKEHQTVTLVA